ncbi:hypothetical protein HYU40_02695 [Candidatus Woesearchaeota archaeon]|nr:hypothetical protein [Candidatus Woesearchaeota archaeon]
MDVLTFLLLNLTGLIVIFFIDRKNIKTYIGLGLTAFALVFVIEILPLLWGFWTYHVGPKVWMYSIPVYLLFFPFISFSYFFANKIFSLEQPNKKRQRRR